MEWTEPAIVIGVKRHGETSAILEVVTPARGRHLGLVRGGRGRRLRAVLQPGNTVAATWRARLDEHLGHFSVEPIEERAATLMGRAVGAYAVQLLGEYLRLLPERDPHPRLFDALDALLAGLARGEPAAEGLARFELLLLDELGAGLDLKRCAATGGTDDLAYVSPRTGRAVGRAPGAPYAAKLLPLPPFLTGTRRNEPPGPAELAQAFRLTGFFLERNVFGPQNRFLPDIRAAFLAAAGVAPAETPPLTP